MGNICDGNVDCKFRDDEYLCDLKHIVCPKGCTCLTFATLCSNIFVRGLDFEMPFTVMYIARSIILLNTLRSCRLRVISVTHSHIRNLCGTLFLCIHAEVVVLAFNSIKHIDGCFGNGSLKGIDLSNNNIKILGDGSFLSLKFLTYLNLSSNPLLETAEAALSDLPQLRLVSMLNISVKSVSNKLLYHLNVRQIETQDHALCCLEPAASCSASTPWYFSCTDILINSGIRNTYIAVSCGIFLANLGSFGVHSKMKNGKSQKWKTNDFLIKLINTADLYLVLPLFGIWISDVVYKHRYFVHASDWTSSAVCHLIQFFFLNFSFLSPALLWFYSFARFHVVKYPMDSKMKNRNFVLHRTKQFFAVSFCLSILFTLLVWLHLTYFNEAGLLLKICSPFADPSGETFPIKITTFLTIALQFICSVSIFKTYVKLFHCVKKSQEEMKNVVSKQRSMKPLLLQIFIMNVSNLLCWSPAWVVYCVFMLLESHVEILFWTTIAVNPINSFVYPLLFVVTSLRK